MLPVGDMLFDNFGQLSYLLGIIENKNEIPLHK
jgi:hypothetical protein